MNILILPSRDGAALPAAVCGAAARATREELALLAVLAAMPALGIDYETHIADLAAFAGVSEKKIEPILQFWRGAGVLTITEEPAAAPACETPPHSRPTPSEPGARALLSSETHHYTGIELEALLCANDGSLRHLIDECQNMAGKIFTPTEVSKIVFLSDQLRLTSEHILLLFTYCIERGKTSVSYLEKTAVNLFNEGVDTAEAFEVYLKRREEIASYEGRIRGLFGIGERAWTPNEKKYLQTWRQEWTCTPELVERAYQMCIDARGSLSFPYINKILQNWHDSGICTVEAADAAHAAHKAKSAAPKNAPGGSFETEEFIELALKRSRAAKK